MERKWWTLISVCVATLMLLIDVTIVNVALPDIQNSLHGSFSDVQWVIDAYSLMLAALLLTAGSLADLFGRRLVFVSGLLVFTASSLLSGVATTPLFLNLARGAQGVGGAMLFATSLALLAQTFRGRERGVAFGVWGAITGVAVAIGPVIGGALTSGLSWRWIFLVNVPIGVIGVIVTLAKVDESRAPQARRPDFIGLITFSGGLGAIVYALIKSSTLGWGSTTILVCLIGGGVLLVAFLVAELLQAHPMFDLSLFRKPTFVGGSVAAFALSAGMFSLLLYLTLYMQDILGYTPFEAGLRLLVLSGGILLTSTVAGRLTAYVPIRLLIGPGLLMVATGVLLMRGISVSTGWTHLIAGFIVAGCGVGLINPPLASTAVGVVEPEAAGMASGINTTFRQVGIATGVAALGSVFAHNVKTKIVSGLSSVSSVPAASVHRIAAGVSQGSPATALKTLPHAALAPATRVVHAGFVTGLNAILLIGAIVAGVAGVLSLVLIRNRDFTAGAAHDKGPSPGDASAAEAATPQTDSEPEPAQPVAQNGSGAMDGSSAGIALSNPGAQSTVTESGADGSAAILHTTEQALADLHRRVEQLIDAHREAGLASAARQAWELRSQALAETERYAQGLRDRARELRTQAERGRHELQFQSRAEHQAAVGATAARGELYRLLGEIGVLVKDGAANGAPTPGLGVPQPSPPGGRPSAT